jgi:hypothetical protein
VVEKSQKKNSAEQKPLVLSQGLGEGDFQILLATKENCESPTTQTAPFSRASCVAEHQKAGDRINPRRVVDTPHLGAQPLCRGG